MVRNEGRRKGRREGRGGGGKEKMGVYPRSFTHVRTCTPSSLPSPPSSPSQVGADDGHLKASC